MSHFTVLVIGENPEKQLKPYDENKEVAPYVREIVSEEDKKRFLEYYIEKGEISQETTLEEAYEEFGSDWNGNDWKKNKDGVWEEWSRYNKLSKWDWYQLGGRWSGKFKLKTGGISDQAYKKAIDFEAMQKEAEEEASAQYDRLHAIVDGRKIPVWKELREKYPDDIEKARKYYHDDQVIVDLNKDKEFQDLFFWNDSPARFDVPKEIFIKRAINSNLSTYAVLYKKQWLSRGDMGWFGMSSNEVEEDVWHEKFNSILDSLSDDTLLSVYDCHI